MRPAPLSLIAFAAAGALAIAGCGGSGGGTTPSGSRSVDTTAIRKELQQKIAAAKKKAAEKQKSGSSAKSQSAPPPPPSGPAPTGSAALPNQGTKAPAPGVPTAKGGDNSIQTFGLEGDSGERVQAASTAKAYFEARAAARWGVACSYLAGPLKTQLEALLKGAKGAAKSCTAAMKALSTGVPKAPLRSAARIHVLSLRVKGPQAFLIYRDGKGTPTALPMAREGGAWRVGAIAGSALLL